MLAAMNHEPVDRVPTDIWATGEVWAKLRGHFGAEADLRALLHIDGMAGVGAKYVGPPAPAAPPGETSDFWGRRWRKVSYGTGEYTEQSYCPLAEAETIDDLERYPWPRAEWFDRSEMRAQAEAARRKQVVMCGYMAPFYYHTMLRGLETALMDPLTQPEFTHHLLGRLCDFFYEHHRRMFEACAGLIDVTQVTDDFGTQTGPMISVKTFRAFYRPHMKRFAGLAHEFGIKVFHHDDGAIRDFIPDLIEIGVDILNPVQWTCPGMELTALKRDFGKALCFHGAVDNQRILSFGTPEEVRAEVRRDIDALASDGTGYILAPCHNLQAISPVENIIAMYDEAWKHGRF
jgi:uroporphyrinogen decarboxylase